MQNVLSIVLAVIIGLTSMCGGVAAVGKPVSMELGFTVDGDFGAASGADASGAMQIAQLGTLKGLLSALSLRFAADATTGQMEIKLKGAPVASLSAQQQDGAWAVVSTLFPGSVLTVQNTTIQALQGQMGGMGQVGGAGAQMNPEDLAAMFQEPLQELTDALAAKLGETEVGSFVINGVTYTSKTPYSMTTKEIALIGLNFVKKIAANEMFSSVSAMTAGKLSPEQIDQAIADMEAKEDADLPELSLAVYGNEAGETCTECILSKENDTIVGTLASSGQNINVDVDAAGQAGLQLAVDAAAKTLSFRGFFEGPQGNIAVDGTAKANEDGANMDLNFNIGAEGKGLDVGAKFALTYDAPVFSAAEGLNTVALEEMMQSDEAASAFSTELTTGLMALLGTVMQQFPELAAMMMPSTTTTTTTEAVPAN